MRMTIEIDRQEVTIADEETTPSAPADAPPSDVMRAAEKLGAFSAGPAPVHLALEANVRGRHDASRRLSPTDERAGPGPAAGAAESASRKKTKRGRKANT